jgi:F-type H+-transporting ATPase subunit b
LELINFPILISSAIGFGIMFWVLAKFLWKPVLGVIDERRESIEAAFQEVDDAREDVARLQAEYEAKLSEISAEAQAKVHAAVERGEKVAAEIRAQAEENREALLHKAHAEIEREKDKALAELRNTAIDLSFEISSRVLKDGLDRQQHDNLVQSFIGELKELK